MYTLKKSVAGNPFEPSLMTKQEIRLKFKYRVLAKNFKLVADVNSGVKCGKNGFFFPSTEHKNFLVFLLFPESSL